MDAIAAIVRHPVFWAKTYDFSQAFHDDLGIDDAAFAAFEELVEPHIREERPDGDDEELVVRLLSIPVELPGGFTWELELYDNGDDAGVTHYLSGPYLDERIELGRMDAHPIAAPLQWSELLAVVEAARREERNRASGVADLALLLLFPVVRVPAAALSEARIAIEQAWSASGLMSADSARALAKRMRPVEGDPDDTDDDAVVAVARLLAAIGH